MQKLNLNLVREQFLDLGLKIFTANDLKQIFSANQRAAEAFLSYNSRKGYLLRLKRSFYAFKRNLPHEFLIANQVYSPSYVSLETALSFYQLIPETIYSITSVTTKKTNRFLINEKQFIYHHLKTKGFTGYEAQKINKERAYLALPEKAVADFTYFVFLRKKKWNERLAINKISQNKVKGYLKILGGEKLIKFWEREDKSYD